MYRKYYGTNKYKYIKFNLGKVKENNKKNKYFRVKGQYLDFNSKNFSKAITITVI